MPIVDRNVTQGLLISSTLLAFNPSQKKLKLAKRGKAKITDAEKICQFKRLIVRLRMPVTG